MEYIIVKMDHAEKKARVSLRAAPLLDLLTQPEEKMKKQMMETNGETDIKLPSLWRPEYASYMVEGTPGYPYGSSLNYFNTVEYNMRASPLYLPDPQNSFTRSLFWPSEATYLGHPRFARLSENIRKRRGEKVAINVPIFKDTNTPSPFREDLAALGDDGSSAAVAKDDHVYLDAMGFGMGLCCLQLTFQAESITEARELYDQLAPLCPIMLALTAASPCHRGYLVDTDCRWDIISGSVDDRTRQERGLEPRTTDKFVIPKSRYDSIDSYLSCCAKKWEGYNDIPVLYDPEVYKKLIDGGVDDLMAQHVAHLFIRDSVSMFSNKVREDGNYDEDDMDHFENIQSTNWQTMRFKPPPPGDKIGWRVEFR